MLKRVTYCHSYYLKSLSLYLSISLSLSLSLPLSLSLSHQECESLCLASPQCQSTQHRMGVCYFMNTSTSVPDSQTVLSVKECSTGIYGRQIGRQAGNMMAGRLAGKYIAKPTVRQTGRYNDKHTGR